MNSKLNKLNINYDDNIEYKSIKKLKTEKKLGNDIEEEGYAIEIFLYYSIDKTDFLMKSFYDLGMFNNFQLYIKDNFNELNRLFFDIINKSEIEKKYLNREKKKISKIKNISIKNNKNKNTNNNENVKKTKMYYFNNFPLETRY